MKKDAQSKIGILITVEQKQYDFDGFNIDLSFIYRNAEGKVRNVTDSFDSPNRALESIAIKVHGSKHYERAEVSSPWAILRYGNSYADVDDVERAAKIMRKVENAVNKMRENEGAADWVGMVTRYCRALGVTWTAIATASRGSSHDDTDYLFDTFGGATFTLRKLLEDHCTKYGLTVDA